jgi:heat shock protein HtpX
MWLLVALMFAILYGVIVALGSYMGAGSATTYLILAFMFLGLQYWFGPSLVAMMMKVKWVTEKQEPELHQMVTELAKKAGIPKPRVGISEISVPNAFAFGRTRKDGRICVTQGIRRLLNKDELKAVIGHEISHIKHRDMMIITLLSVIPLILYWVSWSLMWGRMFGGRRQREGYSALIGLGALVAYF